MQDITFAVPEGQNIGVIGPNGSGKSTLINVITGFYAPSSGSVTLAERTLSELKPEQIRKVGIIRTFQNLRLVQEMTVLENCLAGLFTLETEGLGMLLSSLGAALGLPKSRQKSATAKRLALEALRRVGLETRVSDRVSELSYAEQKRLELARSIALRPRFLILDEPTAGMGVEEADQLVRMIVDLSKNREAPMTLILIEHRLELVLDVSDRVIVMDGGRVVADGDPEEVGRSQVVREIYVGGE